MTSWQKRLSCKQKFLVEISMFVLVLSLSLSYYKFLHVLECSHFLDPSFHCIVLYETSYLVIYCNLRRLLFFRVACHLRIRVKQQTDYLKQSLSVRPCSDPSVEYAGGWERKLGEIRRSQSQRLSGRRMAGIILSHMSHAYNLRIL